MSAPLAPYGTILQRACPAISLTINRAMLLPLRTVSLFNRWCLDFYADILIPTASPFPQPCWAVHLIFKCGVIYFFMTTFPLGIWLQLIHMTTESASSTKTYWADLVNTPFCEPGITWRHAIPALERFFLQRGAHSLLELISSIRRNSHTQALCLLCLSSRLHISFCWETEQHLGFFKDAVYQNKPSCSACCHVPQAIGHFPGLSWD